MPKPILDSLTTEFVENLDRRSTAFEVLLRAGELAALCDEPCMEEIDLHWEAIGRTIIRIRLLLNKFLPSSHPAPIEYTLEEVDAFIERLVLAKAQGE